LPKEGSCVRLERLIGAPSLISDNFVNEEEPVEAIVGLFLCTVSWIKKLDGRSVSMLNLKKWKLLVSDEEGIQIV